MTCPTCSGIGRVFPNNDCFGETCSKCGGSGQIPDGAPDE